MRYKFETERLAYWYLRLNGFLTIENFILHDELGGPQRTDLDLVAVRFPHRREALRDVRGHLEWMEDDPRFAKKQVPFVAFVEVATRRCKLNGPWTNRAKCNMPRALRAIGAVPGDEIERASEGLHNDGWYRSDQIALELGLVSIGSEENIELSARIPNVLQILWDQIADFIFDRFANYERIKREHPQWDLDGHCLWRAFQENRHDKNGFGSSLVRVTSRASRDQIDEYCRSRVSYA